MACRICVVGNSGSGKTHLARRLSGRLGLPHVELDGIYHRAGWTPAPAEEFRAEVRAILDKYARNHGGWVVDGNYRSRVADVLDPDMYVWLDYPRRVVIPRILRRTLGRLLLRRELWNGNRESWSSLLKRTENVVLWSVSHHDSYRRTYAAASAQDGTATWVRLRTPTEADRWLSTLRG